MKILFVTPGLYKRGGIIVVTSLARQLGALGHDVEIVCFEIEKEKTIDAYFLGDTLKITYLQAKESDSRDKIQFERIATMSDYIQRNCDRFDNIVIDSWFNSISAIQSNVSLTNFVQLVQSLPEFIPEDDSLLWKAEMFKVLPRFSYKKIAVSKALKLFFEQEYKQKISSIDLFLDKAYLEYCYNPSSKDTLQIISSASEFNSPDKGLVFLLDGLAQYKNTPFELTLMVNSKIEMDLTSYRFPIKIVSAKNPEEALKIFNSKDIYINTSRRETFCLALAEAMSIGMPSIVTDSIGNRDYIHKNNSILIDTADYLHDAIDKLKDRKVRTNYSHSASKSMSGYTIETTIDQLVNVLND